MPDFLLSQDLDSWKVNITQRFVVSANSQPPCPAGVTGKGRKGGMEVPISREALNKKKNKPKTKHRARDMPMNGLYLTLP